MIIGRQIFMIVAVTTLNVAVVNLDTGASGNGIFFLNDPRMTNHPYRFYRGRVP